MITLPLSSSLNRSHNDGTIVPLAAPAFRTNNQYYFNGGLGNTWKKVYSSTTPLYITNNGNQIDNPNNTGVSVTYGGKWIYFDNLVPKISDGKTINGVPVPYDTTNWCGCYAFRNEPTIIIRDGQYYRVTALINNQWTNLFSFNYSAVASIIGSFAYYNGTNNLLVVKQPDGTIYSNFGIPVPTDIGFYNGYLYLSYTPNKNYLTDQKYLDIVGVKVTNFFITMNGHRIYSSFNNPWTSFFISTNGRYFLSITNNDDSSLIFNNSQMSMIEKDGLTIPAYDWNRRLSLINTYGADSIEAYQSDLATQFNYSTKVGDYKVHFINGNLAAVSYKEMLLNPVGEIDTLHISNSNVVIQRNGQFYIINTQDTPKVQEVNPYLFVSNNNAAWLDEDNLVTLNDNGVVFLNEVSPQVLNCPIDPNSTDSIIQIAGAYNANFEITNNIFTGGILSPVMLQGNRRMLNLETYLRGLVSSTHKIDYYVSQTGPSDSSINPTYFGTRIPSNDWKVDLTLTGISYPSPGTDPILPIPVNASYPNVRSNKTVWQWCNLISSVGLTYNNKSQMSYFSSSVFYEAKTLFYILGQTYFFDGKSIYLLSYENNTLSDTNYIINSEGLLYLGCSSTMAFFYSKWDKIIYAFTGGRSLDPIINLSNAPMITSGLFNQSSASWSLISEDGTAIQIRNGVMINLPGNYSDHDAISSGIIYYNADRTQATIFAPYQVDDTYTMTQFNLSTMFLGGTATDTLTFNRAFIRLINNKRNTVSLKVKLEGMLDYSSIRDGVQVYYDKTHTIKNWWTYDDAIIEIPRVPVGVAYKLTISSNDQIFIASIDFDIDDPKNKRPINQTVKGL